MRDFSRLLGATASASFAATGGGQSRCATPLRWDWSHHRPWRRVRFQVQNALGHAEGHRAARDRWRPTPRASRRRRLQWGAGVRRPVSVKWSADAGSSAQFQKPAAQVLTFLRSHVRRNNFSQVHCARRRFATNHRFNATVKKRKLRSALVRRALRLCAFACVTESRSCAIVPSHLFLDGTLTERRAAVRVRSQRREKSAGVHDITRYAHSRPRPGCWHSVANPMPTLICYTIWAANWERGRHRRVAHLPRRPLGVSAGEGPPRQKSGRGAATNGLWQRPFPPVPCRRCGELRQGAKHNYDRADDLFPLAGVNSRYEYVHVSLGGSPDERKRDRHRLQHGTRCWAAPCRLARLLNCVALWVASGQGDW